MGARRARLWLYVRGVSLLRLNATTPTIIPIKVVEAIPHSRLEQGRYLLLLGSNLLLLLLHHILDDLLLLIMSVERMRACVSATRLYERNTAAISE